MSFLFRLVNFIDKFILQFKLHLNEITWFAKHGHFSKYLWSFVRALKTRSMQNGRLHEHNVMPAAGARVAQDSRSEGVCIISQIYAVTEIAR
jgi:hypothetical protein